MCNAKTQRKTREEIARLALGLGLPLVNEMPPIAPRYRIGPKAQHVILHQAGDEGMAATMAQWDLVPPPAKTPPKPFLRTNARADGLTTTWPWKVLLRDERQNRRCVTPVDGFFEPEKPAMAPGTVPWSFYERTDSGTWWMAGLWTEGPDPKTGEVLPSYTIITTEANAVIRIHDRMPVLLDAHDARRWLTDPEPPLHLLRPYPAELMHGWRVGDAAKSSRGPDEPALIAPVAEAPAPARASLL